MRADPKHEERLPSHLEVLCALLPKTNLWKEKEKFQAQEKKFDFYDFLEAKLEVEDKFIALRRKIDDAECHGRKKSWFYSGIFGHPEKP